MKYLNLGVSLYVPCTRLDLLAVANGERHAGVRSLIFCTEDAVRDDELEASIANLAAVLPRLASRPVLRFVRVRGPEVLRRVLSLPGIERVDGFVLPKVTRPKLRTYLELLEGQPPFELMPTIETAEAFDPAEMQALRRLLCEPAVRPRILSLRIGGNDLLALLGVRRSPSHTIYQTALGQVVAQLAGAFRPHGFNLTAPVFEGLRHPEVLASEVDLDLAHGLFGKTAVHPEQVKVIESLYSVTSEDLEMAQRLVAAEGPAVFRMHDTMCERATHGTWAQITLERAQIYGVRGREPA